MNLIAGTAPAGVSKNATVVYMCSWHIVLRLIPAIRKDLRYGRTADTEHQPGGRAVYRVLPAGSSDAGRQDGVFPGEQPQAHPELLPKLGRAGQQPGPGHPRGRPEPPRAGPTPKGSFRDLEPGGDQRLLRTPKLGVVVLP